MKKSWKRLQGVFRLRLQKTSSRPLQDVLIKTNIFVLNINLQDAFKTFSRRFQVVFKTSCKIFLKTSSRRVQDMFKTCSKYLQDVFQKCIQRIFNTSSRHFEDVLQVCLQDNFSAYHQVKLFLLLNLADVFNTFLRRTAKKIFYRTICQRYRVPIDSYASRFIPYLLHYPSFILGKLFL